MLAKIIEWSGKNRFLVLLGTLFIVAWGVFAQGEWIITHVQAADKLPAAIVSAQTAVRNSTPEADYVLTACTLKGQNDPLDSALRLVNPAGMVRNHVQRLLKKALNLSDFKPTLLEGPQHGTLEYKVERDTSASATIQWGEEGQTYRFYVYDPEPGFMGKDSAKFMVEFEGKRYQVEVEIKVMFSADHDDPKCDDRILKEIKVKPSHGEAGDTGLDLSSIVSFASAQDGHGAHR